MNRQQRRAAARGYDFVSVMFGDPDAECEHCRALGLAGADHSPGQPDSDGDGSGSEAVFTSFPPTP